MNIRGRKPVRTPLPVRFFRSIEPGVPDDCWEWRGWRNPKGYGQITVDGRSQKSHRIAYQLAVGPIPKGLVVMHRCDNPPCCNPAHLSLGSIADNNRDAQRKGRKLRPGLEHQCGRGHRYTTDNTYLSSNGRRACRTCRRMSQIARRAAK